MTSVTYPTIVHLQTAFTFLFMLEGNSAACTGEPFSANPYEQGSPEQIDWSTGWTQTHSEGLMNC